MDQPFQSTLADLFLALKDAHSPLIKYFQEGISKQYIEQRIAKSPLTFPQSVFDLYAWKNGVSPQSEEEQTIGDLTLFTLGIFTSFETAFDDYISYSTAGYWPFHFFPLFSSGGGDYFLLNAEKDSGEFGTINFYSPSETEFRGMITYFDSLERWAKTILECYQSAVYQLDENNMLDYDVKEEFEIFSKNNPKSRYWALLRGHLDT